MLSLALTGVVMVVISMAIHLQLMTLNIHRGDVEQALLARSVLRHMAADIRNAVWYEQLDMSSLASMATTAGTGSSAGSGNTGSGNTGGGNTGGSSTGGSSTGGSSTGGSSTGGSSTGDGTGSSTSDANSLFGSTDLDLGTDASANTTDIANTVTPTTVPGLYGNQYELRIDCSRLPRVDEYNGTAADPTTGAAASIPSDVKTVSYFLRTEESATGVSLTEGSGGSTGLVRRVMDRAVASWSAQDGSLDSSEHPGDVLAAEISYLEFRYSDGSTWYTEWDSEQMGGLPVAIEITVGIDSGAGQNLQDMDVTTARQVASEDQNRFLYRLVVHLPVAQPLTTENAAGTTGDSTGSSSGSSGTSGGTSGTSGGGSGTAQGGTRS